VKVTAAASGVVARGPGRFLLRNKTGGVIFLSTGAVPETGEVTPPATEAEGYELAGGGTLEASAEAGEAITAIAKSGEGEQELHVLCIAPH
jgi:hypothetical protein